MPDEKVIDKLAEYLWNAIPWDEGCHAATCRSLADARNALLQALRKSGLAVTPAAKK